MEGGIGWHVSGGVIGLDTPVELNCRKHEAGMLRGRVLHALCEEASYSVVII